METVIWDWNGTLIDDVIYSMNIMNSILSKRKVYTLTYKSYRESFSFPIEDYYRKMGLSFKSKKEYNKIVEEFNVKYRKKAKKCNLYPEVILTLSFFKKMGFKQNILSGLNQNDLNESVQYYNLFDFFESVVGSDNMDASDKSKQLHKMLKRTEISNTVLIGDTTLDYELAKNTGCKCVLVSHGHQSEEQLRKCDALIVDNFSELRKRCLNDREDS